MLGLMGKNFNVPKAWKNARDLKLGKGDSLKKVETKIMKEIAGGQKRSISTQMNLSSRKYNNAKEYIERNN